MAVEFDFSKLDPMDVLDLACYIEREAAENYEQLAAWAEKNSPGAASFFQRMARLESQHDSQIEERRRALFGDLPSRYTDSAPWEVEVPNYDEDFVSDPQTVTILEGLAEEEVEHQRLLKKEMAAF